MAWADRDTYMERLWALEGTRGIKVITGMHPRDHFDAPGTLERPKPLHVRIAVCPSHHLLLLGFETRIVLKFRNR